MNETQRSLLARAGAGEEAAWNRLANLYRPLIAGWLRQHQVAHHDAEDLSQEVMLAVARHLPEFHHNGRVGAFRRWLRTVTLNLARDFWKAGRGHATATGDSHFLIVAQQMEDPDSELARQWDQQHNQYVLRCLLDLMEMEFEPRTLRAFRRLVLDEQSAEQVATELGLSVGAVYVAKSRVLQRIRKEGEGLID